MPLNQQLKSEMTGIPTDAHQKEINDKPVIDPINTPTFDDPKATETPASETDKRGPVETSVPEVDQMTLLLSIASQLKGLNDNIISLGQIISSNKNADFCAVFAKIDAARMSIEKLLPARSTHHAEEAKAENSQVVTMLQSILEKQERNDRQLAQALRDNANFQIQVRQGMQHDLDKLKEQMTGEQFNPILKEIASVYVEHQSLLDDESITNQSRKNLQSLFEQLEDILSDYGAEICRSEIGSVRQTRNCKIIKKIPTGQKENHNTIAVSRKPGVLRERSVLYPEFVDVFVFDPSLAEETAIIEEVKESDEPTVCVADDECATDTIIDTLDNDNLGGNEQ